MEKDVSHSLHIDVIDGIMHAKVFGCHIDLLAAIILLMDKDNLFKSIIFDAVDRYEEVAEAMKTELNW